MAAPGQSTSMTTTTPTTPTTSPKLPTTGTPHRWTFFRAGGVDQVVFRSGQDIARLAELDQKLWAALACPTRGLQFDDRTLDLIDTNHDGRIRAPELIAASQWACARLDDPERLMTGGDSLPLAAVGQADDEGRALAESAREVLRLRGREGAEAITLDDVADRAKLLDLLPFDGDGLVAPGSASDPDLAAVLASIVATQGGKADRRGAMAADPDMAKAFFKQVADRAAWWRDGESDAALNPFGADTVATLKAIDPLRPKVDDWFARCRLAAYDPRAAALLNAQEDQLKALGAQPLGAGAASAAELPLATVAAGQPLPLCEGLNPSWAAMVGSLRDKVVAPLIGARNTLTEAEWQALDARLAAARDWYAKRPATALDALSPAQVKAWAEPAVQEAVMALFAQEDAAAAQQTRVADLERLLHLQRDLLKLLNNFVSFADFYRRRGAIFQAGRLYLDSRSCELSVRVDDVNKHAALALMAKSYLAYCECKREGKTMFVVSAFTAGDTDFLFVGRNGIFYDRDGLDWDARITKVIENPTSVGQAFFSPYKKFLRTLEEQIAKRAAASETTAQGSLGGLAGQIATTGAPAAAGAAAKPPAAPGAPLPGSKFDVGTVAALGVALGSLSAVAVAIFTKFVDLGWWIPVAVLGLVLAISGPSMMIAWLKLRQRSLGPILDASGWAINGRLRINVPLGGTLSQSARVPRDAVRQLRDPYAPSQAPAWTGGLLLALVLAGLLAWQLGWFTRWWPGDPQRVAAVRAASQAGATQAQRAASGAASAAPPSAAAPASPGLAASPVAPPSPAAPASPAASTP